MKRIVLLVLFLYCVYPTQAQYEYTGSKQGVRYQGEVNLGYSIAVSSSKYFELPNFLVCETVHGLRVSPHFFTGIGAKMLYSHSKVKLKTLPVFANVRYYLFDREVAPYVAIDAGYNIGLDSTEYNGFYGSLGVGLTFKYLNFGIGYQMIQSPERQNRSKTMDGLVCIKVGATF